MPTHIYLNTAHYLELVVLDSTGNYVSGLTIAYEVRKCSDNSLVQNGNLAEVGVTGVYSVSFTPTEVIEYRVKYFAPAGYEDGFENLITDDETNGDITFIRRFFTNKKVWDDVNLQWDIYDDAGVLVLYHWKPHVKSGGNVTMTATAFANSDKVA